MNSAQIQVLWVSGHFFRRMSRLAYYRRPSLKQLVASCFWLSPSESPLTPLDQSGSFWMPRFQPSNHCSSFARCHGSGELARKPRYVSGTNRKCPNPVVSSPPTVKPERNRKWASYTLTVRGELYVKGNAYLPQSQVNSIYTGLSPAIAPVKL